MQFEAYIALFQRRWWIVALTIAATIICVALGSRAMVPIYSASCLIRVAQVRIDSVSYTELNYAERLIQTNAQVLKSRPFLEQVAKRLDLQTSPEDLAKTIKVEPVVNTELIRVTSESSDANLAAAVANTLAALLVEQGQQIYGGQGRTAREILLEQVAVIETQLAQDRAELARLAQPAQDGAAQDPGKAVREANLTDKISSEEQTYALLLSQYDKARVDEALRTSSISLVEPAVAPPEPAKPNLKLNLVLGGLIGLVGGLGLAFILDRLDPIVYSAPVLVEIVDAPLLGRIPNFKGLRRAQRSSPFLIRAGAHSAAAEAFLVLGASVQSLDSGVASRSMLVTSAEPGSGKSTVVANLAAALARTGRRVIVVDGDLHNPTLHRVFGLSRTPGLADVIHSPGRLPSALQQTHIQGVKLLAAGSPHANPSELWQTGAMAWFVRHLGTEADTVLWDSPPILGAADAVLLGPLTNGVLLVATRNQSRVKDVDLAATQLRQVGATVLGTVYNRATEESFGYYDHYHSRISMAAPGKAARETASAKEQPREAPQEADAAV